MKIADMQVAEELQEFTKLKLWEGPMHKWSEMLSCSVSRPDENYNLIIKFRHPTRAEDVKIVYGAGLRFWNRTNSGEYCWMKYAGPRYVLVNNNKNCLMEIPEYQTHDGTYRGDMCEVENGKIHQKQSLYHHDYCVKEIDNTNVLQTFPRAGYDKIYCFMLDITVGGHKRPCPDHIFDLPITTDYAISNQHRILHENKAEKASRKIELNPADLLIEKDIRDQLKVSQLKIIANVTEELEESNTVLNRMLHMVGANITLTEMPSLPTVIQDQVDSALGSVRSAWDWVKTAMSYVFGFAALFMLCALAPLVELLIIALKFVATAFSRMIGRFKSASNSVSKFIPKRASNSIRLRTRKNFY